MPVQLKGGKVLLVEDGKVATASACCCCCLYPWPDPEGLEGGPYYPNTGLPDTLHLIFGDPEAPIELTRTPGTYTYTSIEGHELTAGAEDWELTGPGIGETPTHSRCLIKPDACLCSPDSTNNLPAFTDITLSGFVGETVGSSEFVLALDTWSGLNTTASRAALEAGFGSWTYEEFSGFFRLVIQCESEGLGIVIFCDSEDPESGHFAAGVEFVFQGYPCILNDPIANVLVATNAAATVTFNGAHTDFYNVHDLFLDSYFVGETELVRVDLCTWLSEGGLRVLKYDSGIYKWTLDGVEKSGDQDGPAGIYGAETVSEP